MQEEMEDYRKQIKALWDSGSKENREIAFLLMASIGMFPFLAEYQHLGSKIKIGQKVTTFATKDHISAIEKSMKAEGCLGELYLYVKDGFIQIFRIDVLIIRGRHFPHSFSSTDFPHVQHLKLTDCTIQGDCLIQNNPLLRSIIITNCTIQGDCLIQRNPLLRSITITNCTIQRDCLIENNPILHSIIAKCLLAKESVNNAIRHHSTEVANVRQLKTSEYWDYIKQQYITITVINPSIQGSCVIQNNPVLHSITITDYTIPNCTIQNNPVLHSITITDCTKHAYSVWDRYYHQRCFLIVIDSWIRELKMDRCPNIDLQKNRIDRIEVLPGNELLLPPNVCRRKEKMQFYMQNCVVNYFLFLPSNNIYDGVEITIANSKIYKQISLPNNIYISYKKEPIQGHISSNTGTPYNIRIAVKKISSSRTRKQNSYCYRYPLYYTYRWHWHYYLNKDFNKGLGSKYLCYEYYDYYYWGECGEDGMSSVQPALLRYYQCRKWINNEHWIYTLPKGRSFGFRKSLLLTDCKHDYYKVKKNKNIVKASLFNKQKKGKTNWKRLRKTQWKEDGYAMQPNSKFATKFKIPYNGLRD